MSASSQENEVFKVVELTADGSLRSTSRIPGWSVIYKKDRETRPLHPNSRLFAFSSVHDAEIGFIGRRPFLQIWRGTAEGIESPNKWVARLNERGVERYWNTPKWVLSTFEESSLFRSLYLDCGYSTPKGTVFCKSLTLLEQVR